MLGFDEGNGGDMVFSVTEGFFSSSGLSRIVSGFGFVAGADVTDSVLSTGCSTASESSPFPETFLTSGSSEFVAGDFLKLSGAGFASGPELSDAGFAVVSRLKLDVSSLVVGAAIFSDSWSDSCVSTLVGLELRLKGFAFVGGVTDRVLPPPTSARESDRLSRAGPKGVSLVGELGLLRSFGLGLPSVGTTSALVLLAFARAIFSIQLGCVDFAGVNLGESGLARALSIQLDLFGLNRLDGLPRGDLRPPSMSALVL